MSSACKHEVPGKLSWRRRFTPAVPRDALSESPIIGKLIESYP